VQHLDEARALRLRVVVDRVVKIAERHEHGFGVWPQAKLPAEQRLVAITVSPSTTGRGRVT
jgi:hypothetical protein